ncbi:MAG: hypothetical protein LBK82_07015 [Planctomycetaceae bacterium]|nr:hypothetical protein [Planctomycetaceae bacterium]
MVATNIAFTIDLANNTDLSKKCQEKKIKLSDSTGFGVQVLKSSKEVGYLSKSPLGGCAGWFVIEVGNIVSVVNLIHSRRK